MKVEFKKGQRVRVKQSSPDNFGGWAGQMDSTVGKLGEIIRVTNTPRGQGCTVEVDGAGRWAYSASNLEEIFVPKAGDVIVCKNGTKFTCITEEEYFKNRPGRKTYGERVIFGETSYGGKQSWRDFNGAVNKGEINDYDIAKVIPKTEIEAEKAAELAKVEPKVYSVRQVAEAIHEVTRVPKLPDYEEKIKQLNAHLVKVADPEWKEYQRLKDKFK